MRANIINGLKISDEVLLQIKAKVDKFYKTHSIRPKLVIFNIGNYDSNNRYIKVKKRKAESIGIEVDIKNYSEKDSENSVLEEIQKCNNSKLVSGIIIQLPIPTKFNKLRLINAIKATKDVDGLHPINLGLLFNGSNQCFISPTAQGCIELIKSCGIDLKGKSVVIVNRSNLIGKPLLELFLRQGSTVTICHSETKDLKNFTLNADIVVCAIGRANFFSKEYFKKDSIVIDVGSNKVDSGGKNSIVGDVDFEVQNHVQYLTPSPGAVGPMTVAFLLLNTFIATQINNFDKVGE